MKRKNKLLSLIFALLVFASCFTSFALPSSATTTTVYYNVCYDASLNDVWFPNSTCTDYKLFASLLPLSRSSDNSYVSTLPLRHWYYDTRLNNGSSSHAFCGALLDITPTRAINTSTITEVAISDIDLSNCNLRIYWEVDHLPNGDHSSGECLTADELSKLTPSLGLTDDDVYESYYVPQFGGLYGDDFNAYATKPTTMTDKWTIEREYLITDTDTITAILDGEFIAGFPFTLSGASTEIGYTLQMTLESTVVDDSGSTDTDSDAENGTVNPDVSQNVDFLNPNHYKYYPFYTINRPDTNYITDFSVSDFYTSSGGIKFRDSTDAYVIGNHPPTLITPVYDVILGMAYASGYDDTSFTDSLFNVNKTTLTFGACDYGTEDIDMSLEGFRLEFYISTANSFGFNYSSYTDYLDRVNSYYYGLEPFSIQIGSVTIPYDYFTFQYSSDHSTLLATLELDGKNDAHRMYMKQIYNATSNEITLTFTTPTPIGQGTFICIPSFGFWQKYDAPTTEDNPTTEAPDETTKPDSGLTQEDLDAAYQNGFNQGLSQGSDKNYVYGFINGSFNAVSKFIEPFWEYEGLGGVSLGSVVVSIAIILVIGFFIKKG